MSTLFALVATILTSFLPICNKYLLRDAAPAAVAWIINAASLPILAVGTLAFTQCHLHVLPGNLSVVCRWQAPHFDTVFVLALLASAVLNWAATLLSTTALAQADASLVSPLLTFNPAFTLLVATVTLGEFPGVRQTIGVAVVLFGAYVLEVQESRTGPLAPLHVLLHRRGALLAIIASALWGTTTVLEKLSIEHLTPPSGPAVALLGTFLMVLLLTPGALRSSHSERSAAQENRRKGLCAHPCALALAILIACTAPLFGFTAIALGLVGYVTTLFKLSSVLTILWARVFLDEGQIKSRLLGASVMVLGGLLVAA
jgi:drug/metabolite transporter (DMT)-like permease